MWQMSLQLGPIYSRLASDDDLKGLNTDKLPRSYELRLHQAQTWQAFSNTEAEVIFDTALTGDGKSLAGQLPMLADNNYALLLYPTNELIKDQVKQVERYMHEFGLSPNYTCQTLYSDRITEEIEKYGTISRSSIILTWLKYHNYILSNPDLFHLMSSYNYGSYQDKREFVYQIPDIFDYFIFDEFHIFGPPQVISVMNILNYQRIAQPCRKLKYVFLSATPTRMFRRLLENGGFHIKEIKGKYSSVPAPGYTEKPIVQPVTLHLHSLGEKGAYAWAEEHLTDLIDFFRAYRDTKGVFIVNSVATAKRLVAYYRYELEEKQGIKVGENTGLTDPEARNDAMNNPEVQFIIATSTVDVGVDFKINLLIFESYNAGTFIQRLGRLGRHEGWNEYRAYALLPDWIVDKFAAHFNDDSEVDRVMFLETIRIQDEFATVKDAEVVTIRKPIFQPDQEYKHYAGCWGGLQTAHIIVSVEDWKIGKQGHSDFSKALREQYNKVYRHTTIKDWIGKQVGRYLAMAKDDDDKQILAELNSFRGRSPLDCGIFDETDGKFKRYDLFFLLANTWFYPMPEATFREMVEDSQQDFEKYRSRDLKLYVRLKEYVEERENFSLESAYSFRKKLNQVQVFDNFMIQDSRVLASHLDNSVNERLAELSLVCLVVEGKPKDFKRQSGLHALFPVYAVRDNDGIERSIVFGLNALLAHSLVFWRAAKNDCDEILIV